jgi:hypothetical protein
MNASDRVVHASFPGYEVVRYDRAGKWFVEPTEKGFVARHALSVREAVAVALQGVERGGVVHLGRVGGSTFDRIVRAET